MTKRQLRASMRRWIPGSVITVEIVVPEPGMKTWYIELSANRRTFPQRTVPSMFSRYHELCGVRGGWKQAEIVAEKIRLWLAEMYNMKPTVIT